MDQLHLETATVGKDALDVRVHGGVNGCSIAAYRVDGRSTTIILVREAEEALRDWLTQHLDETTTVTVTKDDIAKVIAMSSGLRSSSSGSMNAAWNRLRDAIE